MFKNIRFSLSTILILCCTTVFAFADGVTPPSSPPPPPPDATIPEMLLNAMGTIHGDILTLLINIASIALGIMGAFLVWRYGVKFFKGLAK